MEAEITIRPATPDDSEALARIHIDSWRVAYRGLVPDDVLARANYAKRAAQFRHALSNNLEETYLVESDNSACGLLTIGGCRDDDMDREITGELWGIYLLPAYWHRGIGRMTAAYAEANLASRGYSQIVLWVFADNEAARRFYEAMGYVADGTSKTLHKGKPLKIVRYVKTLNQPYSSSTNTPHGSTSMVPDS